jgi:hypothetical protein
MAINRLSRSPKDLLLKITFLGVLYFLILKTFLSTGRPSSHEITGMQYTSPISRTWRTSTSTFPSYINQLSFLFFFSSIYFISIIQSLHLSRPLGVTFTFSSLYTLHNSTSVPFTPLDYNYSNNNNFNFNYFSFLEKI